MPPPVVRTQPALRHFPGAQAEKEVQKAISLMEAVDVEINKKKEVSRKVRQALAPARTCLPPVPVKLCAARARPAHRNM